MRQEPRQVLARKLTRFVEAEAGLSRKGSRSSEVIANNYNAVRLPVFRFDIGDWLRYS